MRLSLIVAVADNGIIGRGRELPWHLSSDLQRFKRLTLGHHLLMGRKTFDSIGRALPRRTTVVLSRGRPELPEGVLSAASLDAAIELAHRAGDDEAFVAGGGDLFLEALPRVSRVYLTRVHAAPAGDVRFPDFDPEEEGWRLLEREEVPPGDRDDHATTFEVWERRSPSQVEK